MAAKKAEQKVEINIKPLEFERVEITLEGETPLIMHAWAEKAKKEMLAAQQGTKKGKAKKIRNPVDEFINSMYWLTEKPEYPEETSEEECMRLFDEAIERGAKFGFPATSFKQAAIASAYRMGWVKNMVVLRGVFFLESPWGEFLEIKSDKPVMREDMVKLALGTADLRYRGEFRNWSTSFVLRYLKSGEFSLENIINIINAGGQFCGAGEWRVEKDGDFGRFHVKTD